MSFILILPSQEYSARRKLSRKQNSTISVFTEDINFSELSMFTVVINLNHFKGYFSSVQNNENQFLSVLHFSWNKFNLSRQARKLISIVQLKVKGKPVPINMIVGRVILRMKKIFLNNLSGVVLIITFILYSGWMQNHFASIGGNNRYDSWIFNY